jgi:ABC-type sugar transport system ATPase subunit
MQIKLERIKKIYGARTVLDFDGLLVEEGTLLGIIGPNGAGKSTLLNIIAGIDNQTEGKVYYGTGQTETIPYRDITLVFQAPYLLHTTVGEEHCLSAEAERMAGKRAETTCGRVDGRPGTYSSAEAKSLDFVLRGDAKSSFGKSPVLPSKAIAFR